MKLKLSEIRVGNRIRKDPGDLSELKDSMRRLGLLQPILVDTNNILVAGYRRLESAKALGWEAIETRLVDIHDKRDRLIIEADENLTRRDFTPEELQKADQLMDRYSRDGWVWRIVAWFLDLLDRVFRR
ncbi:MAG: ParB N-terminal domain-containing protein [Leptospirales bacterium]|jgi:ParB family chromosome partitioning protein